MVHILHSIPISYSKNYVGPIKKAAITRASLKKMNATMAHDYNSTNIAEPTNECIAPFASKPGPNPKPSSRPLMSDKRSNSVLTGRFQQLVQQASAASSAKISSVCIWSYLMRGLERKKGKKIDENNDR